MAGKPRKGVRAVALLELTKGVLAVLAGAGLLSARDPGIRHALLELAERAHLNPAHDHPSVFMQAAGALTDRHLVLMAAGGLLYASVRFTEAYGLWFERRWAEWFAALSGAIYIPFEIAEMWRELSWVSVGVFGINVLIVGYMSWVLYRSRAAAAMAANT
jgi:uncharacterized membrane protein (DUF2068 family)